MIVRTFLLALGLLVTVPAASANHWTWENEEDLYVGDSSCLDFEVQCTVAYLCTGDAPDQAVDFAFHCALRAANEAGDVAAWAPRYAWSNADWAAFAVFFYAPLANEATEEQRKLVNDFLCDNVWSHFCSNPIVLPDDAPIADPIGEDPF